MPDRLTPREAARTAVGVQHALDDKSQEALRLLNDGRNVVLYGPPGTGKTHAALAIREWWLGRWGEGSVIMSTFHPSFSYEDFIEGFRPSAEDPSQFTLEDGVLLDAATRAKSTKVLLVIDEINRGDVARVFGELITYIEPDKRSIPFRTAQRRDREREIPKGLHLLATMNTADRSISLLDVALRRRFTFISCPPDPAAFDRVADWKSAVDGISVSSVLTAVNERLLNAGVERDRLVGHAILGTPAQADDSAFFDRLRYDLVPLVEEYLFNDVSRVASVLPGLVADDGLVAEALSSELLQQLAGQDSDDVAVDAVPQEEQAGTGSGSSTPDPPESSEYEETGETPSELDE